MTGTYSTESLRHYRYGSCSLWWSIGDGPMDRALRCPWCGASQTFEEAEPPGELPKTVPASGDGWEIRTDEAGHLDELVAKNASVHIERNTASLWAVDVFTADGKHLRGQIGPEGGLMEVENP